MKTLFYIISPTHLISALCAYYYSYPKSDKEVIILVHWLTNNNEVLTETSNIVKVLAKEFPQIKKIFHISYYQKREFLFDNNILSSTNRLINFLENEPIDEIYFPHDMDGGMFNLLCCVYPDACRICFGDAFGFVFQKKYHIGLFNKDNIFKTISRKVYLNFRFIISKIFHVKVNLESRLKEYKPDKAILILPIDQSGNFLTNLSFEICPKDIFTEIINKCRLGLTQLNQYIRNVISNYTEYKKYLLLTENNAECNAIDFEKETEMYCDIIRNNCETNSVIFIKSHPGEFLPRNESIKKKLSSQYKIIVLEESYKRYPIELWTELLMGIKVICMSSPILSLKYLYNIDVINPMNDVFIEKWFPEYMWNSYKNAMKIYMEPLKRLEFWNGKEILYSGEGNN